MSSLQPTPAGYRIQFRLDQKTRQISLPGAKLRAAEIIQRHLDELIASKRHRTPPQELTRLWAEKIDADLREQLQEFGLLSIYNDTTTIVELLDQFKEHRSHLENSTVARYQHSIEKATLFFKARPLSSLCRADAEDFRRMLLNLKLSENSVRKACSHMSTFVKWMQKREVWTKPNPFDDVPKSVGSAKANKDMISAEVVREIIAEAPGKEWPALLALARWGGIRVPSEAFPLRWEHITWEPGRIHIEAPKTAHQGKPSRMIPLFPEILPYLLSLRESQVDGEEWLFPIFLSGDRSMWGRFKRLVVNAGKKPWAHLWNSLRSTRETELAATYPLHVVCEWIGNSHGVARRHYLKATDDDYNRATASAENAPKDIARRSET